MKVTSYAIITQRENPIQPVEYKANVEKFIKLGPIDWLEFQEHLKTFHCNETCQSTPHPKPKEAISTHITVPISSKSPTKNTIKSKPKKSSIHPLIF